MQKSEGLILELAALLQDGWSSGDACRELGIPIGNFYVWKKLHPELVVDRELIIITRLTRRIENFPEDTVQEICDSCHVHTTTFYRYLRQSTELREAFKTLRKPKNKKTGARSFYAEQLAKKGYSSQKIKSIMKYR
jgi:hypothetical protein